MTVRALASAPRRTPSDLVQHNTTVEAVDEMALDLQDLLDELSHVTAVLSETTTTKLYGIHSDLDNSDLDLKDCRARPGGRPVTNDNER
jgi:hypothetical protein